MKKKFKFISTVAAASIMTYSAFCASSFATTPTKSLGINSNIIPGTKIISYVLSNEDGRDTATIEELKAEYPGATVSGKTSGNVATGDIVKYKGEDYTVIVYGDANRDGAITVLDVQELADAIVKKTVNKFPVAVKEAANVGNHDGSFTVTDVQTIADWSVGKEDVRTVVDISKLPEADPIQDDTVESIYTVTVDENNIINNQTSSSTIPLKIERSEDFDKTTSLTVKFTSLVDDTKTVTIGSKTLNANQTSNTNGISNASKISDLLAMPKGEIKLELLDAGEIVYSSTIVINLEEPIAKNVRTERTNTRDAKLVSLESGYDGDISKVEYWIYENTGSKTRADVIEHKVISDISNISDEGYEIVKEKLDTNTSYVFEYELENSYGSKSLTPATVIITKDGLANGEAIPQQEKVDVEIATDKLSFDIKSKTACTYVVTIKKDGTIISTDSTTYSATGANDTTNVPLPTSLEAGKYTIEVYVEGTDEATASEVTVSDEIEIITMEAPEVSIVTDDNGTVSLSLVNPNDANASVGAECSISLYTVTEVSGNLVYTPATATINGGSTIALDDSNLDFSNISLSCSYAPDTVYVAKAKITAKAGSVYLDSEEAISNYYYIVSTPDMTSVQVSETSIELTIKPISVLGETTKYQVEYAEVISVTNNLGDTTAYDIDPDTKNIVDVTPDENNKVVLEGLHSDTAYAIRLIANVGEEHSSRSSYTVVNPTPAIRTLPVINKVTRVATIEEVTDASKVYLNGTDVYTYGHTDAPLTETPYGGNQDLAGKLAVIRKLRLTDTVKFEADKITLTANASADEIDLTSLTYLQDKVIEVSTNKNMKQLKINNAAEKLLLTAGTFNLDGVSGVKEIVLSSGVDVENSNVSKYTVNAESETTINGIHVGTYIKAIVNVDSKNTSKQVITVDINGDDVENDLTITNTLSKSVDVKFVSVRGNGRDTLDGTITITSNGGTITVSTDGTYKPTVKASVDVTVETGDVTVNDNFLSGENTISVKEGATSTVKLLSEVLAPDTIKGKSGIVVDNNDTVEKIVTDGTYTTDETEAQAIITYITQLDLYGTGATLDVGADAKTLTITFTSAGRDAEISNK